MDGNIHDEAHQAMQELEERTTIALQHVIDAGVPEDDVRLLCYHSGIPYSTLNTNTISRRYSLGTLRI